MAGMQLKIEHMSARHSKLFSELQLEFHTKKGLSEGPWLLLG